MTSSDNVEGVEGGDHQQPNQQQQNEEHQHENQNQIQKQRTDKQPGVLASPAPSPLPPPPGPPARVTGPSPAPRQSPAVSYGTPPSFLGRAAASAMTARRLSAPRSEMDAELTFHPRVRGLPRSYGRSDRTGGSFEERNRRWEESRDRRLEGSRLGKVEKEEAECSFRPDLSTSRNHPSSPARAEQDHEEEDIVSRMYYKETQRLAARRQAHEQMMKQREDEEFRAECTFKPDLSRSIGKGGWGEGGSTSRYLTQSTETAERRRMSLAVKDAPAPGPGEYEKDNGGAVAIGGGAVDRSLEALLGARGGFEMRAGTGGTAAKDWAFAPETNVVDVGRYARAAEYLKKGVVERLTSASDPKHRHALSKAKREEEADRVRLNDSVATTGTRNKEEAKKEFHEFLARQNALQIRKKENVERGFAEMTPGFKPSICKGSREIHDSSGRGTFLQRVERDEVRRDQMAVTREVQGSQVPVDCTFTPAILAKSSKKTARTPRDMSLGDAEAREASNRALRLRVEAEQLCKFSFKPTMNTTYQTVGGRKEPASGRLQVLANPDGYVGRIEDDRRKKELEVKRRKEEDERKELEQCTFRPKTTDCPQYVKRIAHSMQIARAHRDKIYPQKAQIPTWK